MKCFSVLILCTAGVFAQTSTPPPFITGQAARLVIGQTSSFTAQDPNASNTIIGGASGIAYANDTLFVADSNRVGANASNHRVLLFQNLSSMLPGPTSELSYNSKCPVCGGTATVVLGQPDFITTTENLAATPSALRGATAVASDGIHVVVADTDHNRVLIWNRVPTTNDAPADVVVGQPDFVSTTVPGNTPNAMSMRGPQGVWIQNGKLYVADTQNNRILIYNHLPTANGVAADVVLGAPNFTTFVEPDLTQQSSTATASNMLNPVSVTSDGVHLFVSDLGYNRVLIWNSIPSSNGAPADVEIGQPDMVSSLPNNAFTGSAATSSTDTTDKEVPVLCTVSNGTDPANNPTYPDHCNATLNFPRYALAAGNQLFVADGGNDRVLVFNQIPTANGSSGDLILGQIGGEVNQASDASDSLRTPLSLAWDGSSLYVSDAYNRRITVYTPSANNLPYQGVRNSANFDIFASGAIAISGTIQAGDVITVTIGNLTSTSGVNATYTYTVLATDTLNTVVQGVVAAIVNSNSGKGDPNVTVSSDLVTNEVLLTAILPGGDGNNVTYSAAVTGAAGATAAQIATTAAGTSLTGGGDAAQIAPGTIVSVIGSNLSASTANADLTQPTLPTKLGGTEVYFNGIPAPLTYVSPTQINAQIPWELGDSTSINAYVRSVMANGSIMVTSPAAVTIVPANPGVYSTAGTTPVIGIVQHASSYAMGIVDVQGSITAGDVAMVGIGDRNYSYTVLATDTIFTIRDGLVAAINSSNGGRGDPQVTAAPAGEYSRAILTSRIQGPEGDGISITATASTNSSLTMTAFTPTTCCSNVAGAPVTQSNPAIGGEFIIVYATGLGVPVLSNDVQSFIQTGVAYPNDAPITQPQSALSALAGGSTADVISASLMPGMVGVFKVVLHLNASLTANAYTPLTIAQDAFVSRPVTLPVSGPSQ